MAQPELITYRGSRGDDFTQFIRALLKKGNLKTKDIANITDVDGMALYAQAFTHKSIDPISNYEQFEILGDVTCNSFLVWYFSRRFPKLFQPKGVKVLAELKIKYGSKVTFSPIATENGFMPFISAVKGGVEVTDTSLGEDVLEAFIGVTGYLLDGRYRIGVGYAICYNILTAFFDKKHIDISYAALHPPISRLKELFDNRDVQARFEYGRDSTDRKKLTYSFTIVEGIHICNVSAKTTILGSGKGASKVAAENAAATDALKNLRARWNIHDDVKAAAYDTFS